MENLRRPEDLWTNTITVLYFAASGTESLGTLGSQLVTEVIEGCLRTDPCSYLSCFGSNWKPLPGGGTREIRQLLDLAEITGLVPVQRS